MKFTLGPIREISPDGSKQYVVEHNGKSLELFVVNYRGRYLAYENRCPHTGVNLNWQADQFLSLDGTRLQCTVHGALFRIEDGYCEWGPCTRQSLKRLSIELDNGELILLLAEPSTASVQNPHE